MFRIGPSKFLAVLLLSFSSLAQAGSEVGEVASNFTVSRLDGTEFNLSEYRGKKMVNLVFWATWCPVCLAEVPELTALHKDYGDEVELLALSVNASERPIPAYVRKHDLKYPVAIDLSRSVMEEFKVQGTPTQILIDENGVIVYRGSDTPDMQNYL